MNNLWKSMYRLRVHSRNHTLAYGKVFSASQSTSSQPASSTGDTGATAPPAKEKIVIPTRIERGPTDILMALSATVGFDPTAPHYKYHDDPYLIPTSNANKKTYALHQH